MYLGIDFWKLYDLLPRNLHISELDTTETDCKDKADQHQLSDMNKAKLANVVNCFPSFSQEGLGRTNLISHSIDVGNAKPIKQRHFPVSPAVEKSMYAEIDRMLQLGVIEESDSACHFCMLRVRYLGHIIGDGGIRTDPDKVAAIKNFPLPTTLRSLRSFMGLCGWYRKFVPNFASLSAPLTDLMTTKRRFSLTEAAIKSFEELKQCLSETPVLCSPDFSKPFAIHCDASKIGVGAVLVQVSEEGD
ncbi:hypothetical protein KR038_008285, partial [Drosophila bunnanda]